jgi:hypothetical protein
MMNHKHKTRREFLETTSRGVAAGLAASATLGAGSLNALARTEEPKGKRDKKKDDDRSEKFSYGKAEHCIMIWLGGGASQLDTWDPKRLGDPKKKKEGSAYESIPTAIKDVRVCKHLSRCAPIMDRFIPIRSVHHDVIDEHAAAVNRMHTGRPTSGTVVYPSVGSVVAHQRGPVNENAPSYVIMGYPNLTRGSGFLGAKYGYLYLLDSESGPAGLVTPKDISTKRKSRREALLARMRESYLKKHGQEVSIRDYDQNIAQSLKLAGPDFMKAFDLKHEKAALRKSYGGEFGQRCLLARRLVQSGVRFIEIAHNINWVNGTGWDTHNQGQLNQHILIEELDKALSSLVIDLEKKKLLDKTLVVVSTEFGRPAGFDGGGGRGHYSKAFSVVLAGGGLNTGLAVGETDELGKKILRSPMSVPDLFATMYCTMGIDPSKNLHDGDRPVPITDEGHPAGYLIV